MPITSSASSNGLNPRLRRDLTALNVAGPRAPARCALIPAATPPGCGGDDQGDRRRSELRVTVKRGLAAEEVFRLTAYLLLDLPDQYQIRQLGLFDGRSGYLAAWDVGQLLQQLAQRPVSVPALRQDFRNLLRQRPADRAH